MNRLRERHTNEVMPKLQQEFGIKNKMAIPKVDKVVVSIGLGEAKNDSGILDKVKLYLEALTGQTPMVTHAKKSIAAFKVSQGQPVGMMITLRGDRMYAFLDKFISIVLPKVRDFRGIPANSFDSQGNLNIGLKEQTIFPEVDYKNIDKVRGLAVTVVTSTEDKAQSRRLLELLGVPFKG